MGKLYLLLVPLDGIPMYFLSLFIILGRYMDILEKAGAKHDRGLRAKDMLERFPQSVGDYTD